METPRPTFAMYLSFFRLLHAGMIASQVIFAVVSINSQRANTMPAPKPGVLTTSAVVLLGVSVVAYGAGFLLFNVLVARARNREMLSDKLESYQTATLARLAFLLSPSLIGIDIYFVTGARWSLAVAAAAMAIFVMMAPNRARVVADLQLPHDGEGSLA